VESIKDLLTSVSKDTYLKLDISDNNFGVSAAISVASVPFTMKNIHTLNISDNDFGEEGVGIIAEGLCSNTTLKNLILDRNFKGGKHRQTAIENLIKLISANNSLEGLSLVGGKGAHLRFDIIPVLYGLSHNRCLTSLDVSGNQMSTKGTIALANMLRQNHRLTSIVWDENMSGLLGFVNIRNALKTNQNVKYMPLPSLDIANCVKTEAPSAKELASTLNEIERFILRNQQQR